MAYYPTDPSYFSRRGAVLVAIVVLHVLAIWAFVSGLADTGVRYVQTILQTSVIQTEKPKDLPPPPPPVDLKERPPVQVIAPDINITVPVEAPPPIAVVTTRPPPPAPPPVITLPGTAVGYLRKADPSDFYPPEARRQNQEGRAIVKVCVDPTGKVTSADIVTSSGFPLLDAAAIKDAQANRYKPATQGGKPVLSCPTLPVKFELHAAAGG